METEIDYDTIKHYLAIIFINGGSSHAWATNAFEAIENCKGCCERDWGSLYKFGNDDAYINVYDYTNADGWYASNGNGPKNRQTKEPLPYLFTVTCKLKKQGVATATVLTC
jgi:hypothetical protein